MVHASVLYSVTVKQAKYLLHRSATSNLLAYAQQNLVQCEFDVA